MPPLDVFVIALLALLLAFTADGPPEGRRLGVRASVLAIGTLYIVAWAVNQGVIW